MICDRSSVQYIHAIENVNDSSSHSSIDYLAALSTSYALLTAYIDYVHMLLVLRKGQ